MKFYRASSNIIFTLLIAVYAPLIIATENPANPNISSNLAAVLALNKIEAGNDGIVVQQSRHSIVFTQHAVAVLPQRGPVWQWQTEYIGPAYKEGELATNSDNLAEPVRTTPDRIEFQYADITESYVIKHQTVEQQFVIHKPMTLGNKNLLVKGRIITQGKFNKTVNDWQWHDTEGSVNLGQVTVIDARGNKLPASMEVTATTALIQVDWQALAKASYPVTIDPEIGTNDFRISDMGPDGNANNDAYTPEIAYNSANNQYLVVWRGDDNSGLLTNGEFEILGQRIDASNGTLLGTVIRISDMGPNSNVAYGAFSPAVTYNPTANEYLVVWKGDDNIGILADDEFEIFGQRIDAATGNEAGNNDFRISDMGPDGNMTYDASSPAVAYNNTNNEYLVVWHGDDDNPPLVDGEFEIFGQLIDASGSEVASNDFRISDMGPDGDSAFVALEPSLTYNSVNAEYLVVWRGDDDNAPLVDGEYEIFGQRIDATGSEVGSGDFRISDMGPNGNTSYIASRPVVTHNATNNEYFVAWEGSDSGTLIFGEYEIWGQRLSGATGAETGNNDFRISDMGPDGNTSYHAYSPAVTYNITDNEYLVTWHGDDFSGTLVTGEYEVFGQRINAATGNETGNNDFRISDMGPDGDTSYGAITPALAYNVTDNQYLTVWSGDDNTGALANEEFEIFGQGIDATNGAETGDNDFRITVLGSDSTYDARFPDVAYNPVGNEYLVVWSGDDNNVSLTNDEFEIFGQRIDAGTGARLGANLRISDMGPDGNANYDATNPAAIYNITNHEYLVVWSGDDDTAPVVDGEFEIFGQRIAAATGNEVGTNDFRISDMGPDGDANYGALVPDVTYNVTENEYLVVWRGDDNTGTLVDEEFEIFGQRINAATGAGTGNDFRISDMGPDGDVNFDADGPSVEYNITNNEYLVAWRGDDDTGALVDEEFEIYAQRVDAITGDEVGNNDFRISDMGPDGNTGYDTSPHPAVAYNITNNEFLVVWSGDDNSGSLTDDELEIFGQRIQARTGIETGNNDFRISDMGPDGNTNYGALVPNVTYNVTENEYLVVWRGDDNTGTLVDSEFEIFGQKINAATGAETGDNDFRISDMGPDGSTQYAAGDSIYPDFQASIVAYNATYNEYLVVWYGDDNTGGLADDESEIFGQLISNNTIIGFTSSIYVGNEGSTISISIERTGNTGNTVTFDYMTSDGTALSTTDYTTSNGQLTFMPGEKIKTFSVIITGDAIVEDNETVNLNISNIASDFGQTIIDTNNDDAILTIINDDSPATTDDSGTTFVNVITNGGGGKISLWFLLLLGSGVLMSKQYRDIFSALRRYSSTT